MSERLHKLRGYESGNQEKRNPEQKVWTPIKKAANEEVFKCWILGFQIDFPASIFGVGYSAFASSFRFNDVTL
jgi:hypothetical protein